MLAAQAYYPDRTINHKDMKTLWFSIVLASFTCTISCSPDDEAIGNTEQTMSSDPKKPSPEHEGDDEELDPNG